LGWNARTTKKGRGWKQINIIGGIGLAGGGHGKKTNKLVREAWGGAP